MKKITALFVMIAFAAVAFAQEPTENQSGAEIKFEKTNHDFGDITQGERVEHIFTFENTGSEPLVLSNVLASCGCTASDWSRDPIAPGGTGTIKVTYNSTGRSGVQSKVVRVLSNAKTPETRVTIRANVLPKGS